ncbi:MAG: type III-B CRISPR module-associated protein Cmr3 [Thermoflexales bacterium]
MTTMHLFLSPVDVWLFRDGRPFDAGDDHYARSLFPPYPSVMQGAIRSHHLVAKGIDLRDKRAIAQTVGTAEDFGALRMRGPFIARRNGNGSITRYFPVPADAIPGADGDVRAAAPRSAADFGCATSADGCLPQLLFLSPSAKPAKREVGEWLAEQALRDYLSGNAVRATSSHELFAIEHRYGIGIDSDRRTTKEGLLYAAEFVRPQDGVGLYVEVGGYDGWPARGVMRIGGEGRGARFEQVEGPAWPAPPNPLPARFKLYFATPTYFADGWQPASWARFFDGSVTLQAVALRGYEMRGGYDWASGSQKPARRYVPAGSVYYFAANENACLKPNLIQNAVTDYGAEIGFGQVIVSEWKE